MITRSKAAHYLRAAMIALALLLPAVSLVPLGSIWLWEKGYLLYWIGAALIVSIGTFLVQLWLVRGLDADQPGAVSSEPSRAPDQTWTLRETTAWTAVEALAAKADPSKLTSRDAIVDLGLQTVETVARNIHPQDDDPLWRFTVPEALALLERVSRDLRPFVVDNIPLGDQLTVAQVMKAYQWRSVIDVAEKAYDLWRMIRLLNPVAAVTSEARERLTKKLYTGVRDEIARRLMQGYVREVGRAAIDLYGGRLRVSDEDLAQHMSGTTRDHAAVDTAEPLRFLVAGQSGAGKSSLINALLREIRSTADRLPSTNGFTVYESKHASLPAVLLIDSPGIQIETVNIARLSHEARACDLVLWVVAANRAHREIDHRGLDAIRPHFASRPDRRQPPILLIVTHIDLLRPSSEWSPPYDIATPLSEKATSIRAVLEQISIDLDVPMDHIIPVSVGENVPAYNIELVWARITELLPEAMRAHLVRPLRGTASDWTWKQAVVTGGQRWTRCDTGAVKVVEIYGWRLRLLAIPTPSNSALPTTRIGPK